jgi:hypothetical protein
MPIDPNIAMGVRPVEQPNMLGQMAQVMAIRQAQQGYESENAVKDFYAQGGDLSTAEGRRKLMAQTGSAGSKLIGQQSEITARDLGSTEKAIKLYKDQVGNVTDSASAASLLTAVYSNPLTRPFVESMAPLDKALASIPNDPVKLEQWKRGFGLTANKLFVDANTMASNQARIQAAGISAGPANARLNWEKQQQAQVDELMRGGAPSAAPAVPMTGGGGGGVPNALPAIVGATPAAPASPNMLAPGAQAPAATAPVAAQAPAPAAPSSDPYDQIKAIDAKIAPLVNSGNPRATAIVQQLIAQRNAILESAKREFGGDRIDMVIEDPKRPGSYIPVKGQMDQYGVAQPLRAGPMPTAIDINSGTSTNVPVVRPAPRAGYKYNEAGDEVKIPQTGVPEGLRLKPDERWNEAKQVVEQVPGSAAFIEQQRKHGADLGAIKTVETTTKWGKDRIDTILSPKNKAGFENNFGGFTAYATKEFSGDTARVKSELDSLKSDLKERGLQLFRSGGSIGAMTEKEWPIVENMIASLNPRLEADDARDILKKIKTKFDNIESLAAEKYNDQWQGTQYHKPVSTSRTAPSSGAALPPGYKED